MSANKTKKGISLHITSFLPWNKRSEKRFIILSLNFNQNVSQKLCWRNNQRSSQENYWSSGWRYQFIDSQSKLKRIVKELEIQRVRQENLSMKLQIIEARLKRCKSDATIKLLLRDISVLTQKILLPQINIDQII